MAELCQDCGISGKRKEGDANALYAFKNRGFGGEIGVVLVGVKNSATTRSPCVPTGILLVPTSLVLLSGTLPR